MGERRGLLCLLSSGWGGLARLVGALLLLEYVSGPATVMGPLWGLLYMAVLMPGGPSFWGSGPWLSLSLGVRADGERDVEGATGLQG